MVRFAACTLDRTMPAPGRLRRNIVVAIRREELCTGARGVPSPARKLRCIAGVGRLDDDRIGLERAAGMDRIRLLV